MTPVNLTAIVLDESIQCRARIDLALSGGYGCLMTKGTAFPPVTLFGTAEQCWIGDGWHRVIGAIDWRLLTIDADLRPGGRIDALRFALGANAIHGARRSNEDKSKAIMIAFREFGALSDRAIADLVGVTDKTVGHYRDVNCGTSAVVPRKGKEGKVRRPPAKKTQTKNKKSSPLQLVIAKATPTQAVLFAKMAILDLEQIRDDHEDREEAFDLVTTWLSTHRNKEGV